MPNDLGLRTSHISDASDLLGIGARQAAGGFTFLGDPDQTAIGRAFPLRQVPIEALASGTTPAARQGEAAAELASPGDILVIAVDGETEAATWGEAHTLRATKRGLAGVLIDGATRDFGALRRRRFPILCRGSSPIRSSGRLHTATVGAEVVVMGVTVRPGDLIAMDGDGFVCVPSKYAQAVLAEAGEVMRREEQRDRALER
jgi:regulator of RNase E activity RraA